MKRVFLLLLMFLMAVSFVSCDGNSEQEARMVAESFMNAMVDLDMDKAAQCIDDATALPYDLEGSLTDGWSSAVGVYADKFNGVADIVIEKIKDCMSYEITAVEKKQSGFIFDIRFTALDDTADYSNIYGDLFSEENINKLYKKLLNEGKINLSMTEQEMVEVGMNEMVPLVEDVAQNMEIKTETIDICIVVEKIDGKWVVNAEKSGL